MSDTNDNNSYTPDINLDETQKFVRTFERDAAALARGEHPDLMPLEGTGGIRMTHVVAKDKKKTEPKERAMPQVRVAPMQKAPEESTVATPPPPVEVRRPEPLPEKEQVQTVEVSAPKEPEPLPTIVVSEEETREIQAPPPLPPSVVEPVPVVEPLPALKPEEPPPQEPEKPMVVPTPLEPSPEPFDARKTVVEEPIIVSAEETVEIQKEPQESRDEILARLKAKAEASRRAQQEEPAPEPVPAPVSAPESPGPTLPVVPSLPPRPTEELALERLRTKREAERREVAARLAALRDAQAAARPSPTEMAAFPRIPSVPLPAAAQVQPPESTPLHTYGTDFRDRVKEENVSTAELLASQADSGVPSATPEEVPLSHTRKLVYVIGGIVLLLASAASAYVAYQFKIKNPESVPAAPTIATPIFVDERAQLAGAGRALAAAIEQSILSPLSTNSVRLLYTGAGTTTVTNLFLALAPPAPSILTRNVRDEGSMTGVIHADSEQSLFFILSVLSYRDTFAGMLSWERTVLTDFANFYPAYPPAVNTITPVATSTAARKTATPTSGPVVLLGFRDEIVDNHDVRVYRDEAGRARLLYGYWNPTTLIIARNETAFSEVLARLASSGTQR